MGRRGKAVGGEGGANGLRSVETTTKGVEEDGKTQGGQGGGSVMHEGRRRIPAVRRSRQRKVDYLPREHL